MATDLLLYLLEVSLCLALVFGAYRLLLSRLSFHRGNRAVLVIGLLACFLIPLGHWEVQWMPDWKEQAAASVWKDDLSILPGAGVGELESAVFAPVPPLADAPLPEIQAAPETAFTFGWRQVAWLICIAWALGLLVHGFRFADALFKVRRLRKQGRISHQPGLRIVDLPGAGQPFSHLRSVFLYENHQGEAREMILAHEATHIRQAHSADRLLFQLASAILWFHPLMPRYRDQLIECHEYLADQAAVERSGPLPYARLLFGMALHKGQLGPVNHFAYSSTRKRITMIHKSPSRAAARLRYLLLAPLCASLLLLFACANAPEDLTNTDSILAKVETSQPTFVGEAIPVDVPEVRASLDDALQKIKDQPDRFKRLLSKAARWQPELELLLEKNQLPSDFFYLAVAESELERQALSSGGALGMWQFMPKTAQMQGLQVDVEMDERLDVIASTQAAAKLLKGLKERVGNWAMAASAYNRGPGAVQKDLDAGTISSGADLYSHPDASAYLIRIVACKIAMENPVAMGIPAEFSATYEESGPESSPLSPSAYRITSTFGLVDGRPFHKGIDLAAPEGTPVHSTAKGTVVSAREDGNYGIRIVIQHGQDYETIYAHLSKLHVKAGDQVQPGQVIGEVGNTGKSTGPHLHYEVRRRGRWVNPEGC